MLYETLAARVEDLIRNGSLEPGDRIPSVRRLSAEEGVSASTVVSAYLLLERKGLVVAAPQSGFYVRRVDDLQPPEPSTPRCSAGPTEVEVCDLVADVVRAAARPELIPFGAACPDPELFPNRALNRIASAVLRREPLVSSKYDPPPGCEALRKAIAKRSLGMGFRLAPDDIITTCGAMEGITLSLLAVAKPGDLIAIESPTYFGLLQAIENLGMRAVEIPASCAEGINLERLEKAVKTKNIKACVVMPNFHNPLGSLMPDKSKKELLSLLAPREIPVIEDDIYGELGFSGPRPKPLKAFDQHGLVILCSSFSKTLSPGFRVGWAAGGRFHLKLGRLKMVNTISTPSLPQWVIAEFLESGRYDRHVRRLRTAFEHQVQRTTTGIVSHFPEGTKVSRPRGGFLLWVELPEQVNALQLHRKAMNAGISISPGPMFSPQQQFGSCIRLSCGMKWSDRVDEGLRVLGQLCCQLAVPSRRN